MGRTFVVRPSWDPGDVADGDRVIDLDPGRAFGTGGHATTRLVIALAEEVEGRPCARFLDLGCGSGILSVAAARLWPAARGLAVDVDAEATACARENFERNRVTTVETCTGTAPTCPPDNFRPVGTVCRTSAGVCDLQETCTGSSFCIAFPIRSTT